jgi:hypothetical protein
VASASRIDISSEAVRIERVCRGVHAHQGDYLALNLARKLDVIAMGDTIERSDPICLSPKHSSPESHQHTRSPSGKKLSGLLW